MQGTKGFALFHTAFPHKCKRKHARAYVRADYRSNIGDDAVLYKAAFFQQPVQCLCVFLYVGMAYDYSLFLCIGAVAYQAVSQAFQHLAGAPDFRHSCKFAV